MNTYCALLDKSSRYRLVVVDDDIDMYEVVRKVPWKLIGDDQVADAYTASENVTTVLLLDSSVVLESGASVSVIEWIDALGLVTELEARRVLVLYSGEPFAHSAFHRSYAKSGSATRDLDEIITLLESDTPLAKWPLQLSQRINSLSRVIHALQNIFQPVGWDAEKLGELVDAPDAKMTAEIFGDHYSASESAYLGSRSKCHDGGDILQRVNALCDSLGQGVRTAIEDEIGALVKVVGEARTALEMGASPSRVTTEPPQADELRDHLRRVTSAGDQLLKALRDIRGKALEKPQ